MKRSILIEVPAAFSFKHTVYSHGWSDLLPFELDEENWRLKYVFAFATGKAFTATVSETDSALRVEYNAGDVDKKKLIRDVRHIFRLDEDLCDFYTLLRSETGLAWAAAANAGRLLRAPTVFEDLVKSICTTNCTWGLTKLMVTNLVQKLGEKTDDGRYSFPTPAAMASVPETFYRDEMKAGYRSPYFYQLSQEVVSGEIDPESWLRTEMPTPELKKEMKRVKGVGDYAAENLLKLVGRYDGLALDSWLRAQFYKKHNKDKSCPDKKIERHYKKFGEWKGLAIWCDMTHRWFVDKQI